VEAEETASDSKLLPLDKLSEESRELTLSVTKQPTFELDLGPHQLEGSKAAFEYLLDHLELCAIAGRALHVGNYKSRREKDGRLFGDDGEGATGYLSFLYEADGKRVFFVDGQQKGIFTVGGHSIGVLDYAPAADVKSKLEYKLHLWVRVDNRFFAFLSRLFLSKSKSTATRQFTKMLSIPVGVTQKIHDDPKAVIREFDALDKTERETLGELRALVEQSMR
jgi:hypothetical protein